MGGGGLLENILINPINLDVKWLGILLIKVFFKSSDVEKGFISFFFLARLSKQE